MTRRAEIHPTAARWSRVLTFSFGLASCLTLARLIVYLWLDNVARGAAYPLGVLLGVVQLWLFTGIASLPLLMANRWGTLLTFVLCSLVAAMDIGGAHYHAIVGRLPGPDTVALLLQGSAALGVATASVPWSWLIVEFGLVGAGAWIAMRLLAPRVAPLLEERVRSARRGTVGATMVAVALASALPFGLDGQSYFGAISPWIHWLAGRQASASTVAQSPPSSSQLHLALARLRSLLAVEAPGPVKDARYPYCRAEVEVGHRSVSRSAILLIVEGLSSRVLDSQFQGAPMAPELDRVRRENLHFDHFFASGDRSSQALVSIVAGVPVATHRRILAYAPLVRLQGFVELLARGGARTTYVHGSDLSFEQQRQFLRNTGYQEIIEPDLMQSRGSGWGEPDGVVLDKLRRWVETARQQDASRPYFATSFTLSTHDPYVLPEGVEPRFEGDDAFAQYANSMRYADQQLGKFYDWYRKNELPKGTLLMITGDHAPRVPFPGDPVDTTTGEFEYDFRVPFIVAGLAEGERPKSGVLHRAGGHLDIAETLLPLMGIEQRGCAQGRNLLARGSFPPDRIVPSLAGETLEFLYLHRGDEVLEIHLRDGSQHLFDFTRDPRYRHDLLTAEHPARSLASGFAQDYMLVGRYLNLGNHFAPPRERVTRAALAPLRPPLIVSHRGNVAGHTDDGQGENTLGAVSAAIDRGFSWVEIDVGITGDGQVVINHDRELKGVPGESAASKTLLVEEMSSSELESALKRPVDRLERLVERLGDRVNLCVELKAPKHTLARMDLVQATLQVLQKMPPQKRVIIDSFERTLLVRVRETMRQQAARGRAPPWQVAYDLPQKPIEKAWLQFARDAAFDWVYVHEHWLTEAIITQAHSLGLRVLAYPVNDPGRARRLIAWGADAIMTDSAPLAAELAR